MSTVIRGEVAVPVRDAATAVLRKGSGRFASVGVGACHASKGWTIGELPMNEVRA